MKRVISLVLVLVMLLSFSSGAFASRGNLYVDDLSENEEIQLLKEVIYNMSEEEKALFLMMIQSSIEEQKIYKENIDRNYKINYNLGKFNLNDKMNELDGLNSSTKINTQSVAVNLNYFNSQIAALGLPSTAVMLFKAFAASLAAGVADGPLPFGDIAALLTGTITVAYVAANWNTIGPQWNSIARIYTTTFTMIRASVSRSLSDFKAKVLDKVAKDSNDSGSKGEISKTTEKKVQTKLGSEALKKFKAAVKKGLVGSTGESGIKKLKGNGIKIGSIYYEYELKILGKFGDSRLLGNKEPSGKIIFTILTDHYYRKL